MSGKKNSVVKNIIWSIKEINKFNKKYIALMILDSMLSGIFPVIHLLLVQRVINLLQLKEVTFNNIAIVAIMLVLTEIVNTLLGQSLKLKINNFEIRFDTYMQANILKKVSKLDSKDFENSKTYDLINRTQYDANAGILGNIKMLFSSISLLVSAVSYAVILITYNIIIFIIIIIIPIIRYMFEKKYNLLEYDVIKKNTENDRKASYVSYLLTNAEYFKEIKMYGLFKFFIKRYEDIKEKYNNELIKLHNKRTVIFIILGISEIIIDFGVTIFIIFQVFIGNLLIGQYILYSNSISSLKESTLSVFSQISFIYKNSYIVEQIRSFFELENESIDEGGISINEIKSVELKNVSYKYAGSDKYTLENINMSFIKGEFTVIMGYNGAGKSTLMKIIMGLYSDYEGEVYINGTNLKAINKLSYRENISTLFQNYIKYETDIAENVFCGKLDYMGNIAKLNNLLTKVELKDLIGNESQVLGYQFYEGRQLSIGQWQKLALARAIIGESEMYIFDEPNSSLDLISEKTVLDTIYKEVNNKIGIMIAHRFNNVILKSDKIIVLSEGKIVETGTHRSLLKNNGIYNKLYGIQTEIF